MLSPDELEALYEQPDDRRWEILLKVTAKHGLRNSEAITLQRKHIDLANRQIEIIDSKGGKDRVVPIPRSFVDELERYINPLDSDDFLFPNGRGSHISTKYFEDLIRRFAVEAGLYPEHVSEENVSEEIPYKERIVPHTLRHTFATYYLREGASMQKIQKLLGHEKVSTTVDQYGHMTVEDVRDIVDNGGL